MPPSARFRLTLSVAAALAVMPLSACESWVIPPPLPVDAEPVPPMKASISHDTWPREAMRLESVLWETGLFYENRFPEYYESERLRRTILHAIHGSTAWIGS